MERCVGVLDAISSRENSAVFGPGARREISMLFALMELFLTRHITAAIFCDRLAMCRGAGAHR